VRIALVHDDTEGFAGGLASGSRKKTPRNACPNPAAKTNG
jgi:hypothetical protein